MCLCFPQSSVVTAAHSWQRKDAGSCRTGPFQTGIYRQHCDQVCQQGPGGLGETSKAHLLSFRNSAGVTYFVSPSSVSTRIGVVRFFRPGPFLMGSSSPCSTLTSSLSSPEVCKALSDNAFCPPAPKAHSARHLSTACAAQCTSLCYVWHSCLARGAVIETRPHEALRRDGL